jgi:hypothetical protein
MNEVPRTATGRRHVLDGTYTVLLLALAVGQGYALLPASATTPPARVGVVLTEPAASHGPSPSPVAASNHVPPAPSPAERVTPEAAIVPTATTAPTPHAPAAVASTPVASTPKVSAVPPPAPVAPPIRGEWPAKVSGRVLGPDAAPMANVALVTGGREILTDAEGAFTLEGVAADTAVVVKRPGFEKVTLLPGPNRNLEITLKPHMVKAAYLTYFGVADRGIRTRVLDLVARTELNAVVIDIKGDRGWIPYRTEVEAALAAGAQGPVIMKDFEGLIADLKARGVYTIARIVTFKDNTLASHRPDLAIIDTRTGKPWIDNEKLAWVDPFHEEVWSYNIAIAREAARKGFDEIQFDYVRFPTDGRLSAARYSKPNNKDTRLPTIAGFLGRARRELGPFGVFVAADVFGYTAFNANDTDIGQRIEELAPHLDYICPMVYPSGYHVGIPGFRNPVENPFEVVNQSVTLIRKRSAGLNVRVRPWLQDFKDYAFDKRIFGVPEIRAQIKGADDAGALGFMLWNPKNDYTGAALRPKATLAAK